MAARPPTWSPQSLQEKWSGRVVGSNFIKAERLMPNEYWLLSEMARDGKGISTELGPGGGTRGQKQPSAFTVRSPQGAFATGGQAVTGRRRSKQRAANIGVDHATQQNLALQSANTHRRGRVPRRCSIESVDSPSSE